MLIVDPAEKTDYTLDDSQLEYELLFWIAVAGKTADIVVKGLRALFAELLQERPDEAPRGPFLLLGDLSEADLAARLRRHGIGCYTTKARGMLAACRSGLNLRACSAQELEQLHGVGPKTARCFILRTRPGARCAGLDTHVLRYLRDRGFPAPQSTPAAGKRYRELEEIFLRLADEAGRTPAEFDLEIWKSYREQRKRKA